MLPVATASIGDEDHWQPEVLLLLVQKLLESSSGCWDDRATTEEHTIHVKQDAHLRGKIETLNFCHSYAVCMCGWGSVFVNVW